MTNKLVTTERDGGVMIIRLSSPENLNSLTMDMRAQIGAAVDEAGRDHAVRSVFLAADGPSFCAGGDLHMLKTSCDPWTVHRRFRGLNQWLSPLINLDKPVVIGVQGYAVGGGMGLALTGDVLIAGESAKFMAGFFRLGVVPDIATMYHLPRLIGMARAKNFIFSGGTFTAHQAAELGLVAKVVPDDELHAMGLRQAQRLAEGPAEVMGLAKTLMARTFETSLSDMMAFEGFGQVLAMSNPEFHEGLDAAIERRPADFPGATAKAK
ncbi:enoyl-CoA hydratase/isomerase family protein [Noviherbaspirillum sp. Root189]|uniref:enoyl-CoA hydratase/isomerase family protein n=1 Tax=Noviherbaspirillum sp. Root189 TaxID=1736487 RepID=UPI00070B757A|nr:enoyl-CoA hydratase-related protein [Noviherbaspirillum sp. Root189]KRB81573.1 enoyl-CoA hydratase [Noviherbaspirillum sp. Root189]